MKHKILWKKKEFTKIYENYKYQAHNWYECMVYEDMCV